MRKIIEKTLLIGMIAVVNILVLILASYMMLEYAGVDMQLVKTIIA